MNAAAHDRRGVWWVAAILVTLGFLLYMNLAKKISSLQESLAALESLAVHDGGIQREGEDVVNAFTSPSSAVDNPDSPGALVDAVDLINQRKQRQSEIDPVAIAAGLNNRMAVEPSLPKIEQQHANWLNDTLRRMPADAPDAGSLQTTCQGRSCLVSAEFASAEDARIWGRRYILEAGGKQLGQSRTVIVPLGGSDPSVAIQLYFY